MCHCSLRTEAVGRGTYTVLQLSTKRIILLAWRITWRITTCCLNVHRKGSASKCPCREAESSAVRPSWHCRSRSSVSGVVSFFGNKKQSTRAKRSRFVINICISTAFQTDLISPFYDITRITPWNWKISLLNTIHITQIIQIWANWPIPTDFPWLLMTVLFAPVIRTRTSLQTAPERQLRLIP